MDRQDTQQKIDQLVRWGDRTSSFMSLYPNFETYSNTSGSVQFMRTKTAWIAATEPLAEPELRSEIFVNFSEEAQKHKMKAFMLPVSDQLSKNIESSGFFRIQVGAEPVFDLKEYFEWDLDPLDAFPRAKSLLKSGAKVVEIESSRIESFPELWDMVAISEERRGQAVMSFLNQVDPWYLKEHKRFFAIEVSGKLKSFLSIVPVYPRKAFYFADAFRGDRLRSGTSELLYIEVMRLLYQEGHREVRLGMCPLAQLQGNRTLVDRIMHRIFKRSSRFYDFRNLYRFKEKFNPTRWEPLFAVSQNRFTIGSLVELARVHFPDGLLRAQVNRLVIDFNPFRLFQNTFHFDRISARWPKTSAELLSRIRVTLGLLVVAAGLHLLKQMGDWGASLFSYAQFKTADWSLQGLLLGPLFHNTHWHFFGDSLMVLFFLGLLEIIAGSRLALGAATAGLWLSNPVTAGLLEKFLPYISIDAVKSFLLEKDVGISNVIYVAAGFLAWTIKRPLLLVLPLAVHSILVTLMTGNFLSLHHFSALAMGGLMGGVFYRRNKNQ